MDSTEKAGLGKETNAGGELAKESTPSQTPRIIRFPTSCTSPATGSLERLDLSGLLFSKVMHY